MKKFLQPTIIWKLDEGYLQIENIAFEKSEAWTIGINHFSDTGRWFQGTHYHDTYKSCWDCQDEIDKQLKRLKIQEKDINNAKASLEAVVKLRSCETQEEIDSIVKQVVNNDSIKYFNIGEEFN